MGRLINRKQEEDQRLQESLEKDKKDRMTNLDLMNYEAIIESGFHQIKRLKSILPNIKHGRTTEAHILKIKEIIENTKYFIKVYERLISVKNKHLDRNKLHKFKEQLKEVNK